MFCARSCLLGFALLYQAAPKTLEPFHAAVDDDSVYAPEDSYSPRAAMMQMAYNNSVPVEARRACERQRASACPSPSADGSYKCISLADICDGRRQCPNEEDETPVLCFFLEFHTREMARLRKVAIELYRSTTHMSRK